MTRKTKWLFMQVLFNQVVVNLDWGLNVGAYATDFLLALMREAEV